tara:strand:+ start:61 stop:702 length:642 start_codon:yes stop_codon:yes gene_type:complete
MLFLPRAVIKMILQKNKLFGGLIKPRTTAPPNIKSWVSKYEYNTIDNITVCRTPVKGAFQKFFNIITLGKYDASLKGLHYNDLFHLYLYITIGNDTWKLEKNDVVTLTKTSKATGEDCIDLKSTKIKLGDFMKKGESYQTDFWNYNARTNNCQNFAVSLLVSNKIIKKNSKTYKFIKQDAEEVFKRNPKYFEDVVVTITDLGGIFDLIKNGFK